MKSTQHILSLLLVFAGAILAACTKESVHSGEEEPQVQPIEISFFADDMISVEATRSMGGGLGFSLGGPVTRASEYEENPGRLISSLCILQFSDGQLVVPPQFYSTYTSNHEITKREINGKTQYSVRARIVANPIKTTDIYLVANVYTTKFPAGPNYKSYTQADFLADFLSVQREQDISDHAFLMIGGYSGIVNSTMQIHMQLHRLLARLRLSLNIAPVLRDRFNFTSVQIKSVHNRVYFFDSPETIFPVATEANFLDYRPYFAHPSYADIQDGTEIAWYIPTNRRGTNSGISSPPEKYLNSDPGLVNGRSLSTHLVLKGTYTKPGGETSVATITLYPGANVTDNFDVTRGSSYDMSVSINTFDAAGDNRITLEEGPFVAYYYYYTGRYGGLDYLAVDYVSGYQVGEPMDPGKDILNKYQSLAEQFLWGQSSYKATEGIVFESPSSVDADNLNNIVKIRYEAEYIGN